MDNMKMDALLCPGCQSEMDKIKHPDITVDQCPKCGGTFLDKGEIQHMNEEELVFLTKGKSAEEFREYIDGHLVRSDRIADVVQIATGVHGGTTFHNVNYLQISVYFKTPLNHDLHIYSEKLTNKFLKVLGLFRKQDIKSGNEKLDSLYIIQGTNEEDVKSLLTKPELQERLIEFKNRKFKIYKKHGKVEISDRRIVYSEGPYAGDVKYDVVEDRVGVVEGMLEVVGALEF